MTDLYRRLLVLYPPLHRYVFAEEMVAVFSEAKAEAWSEGLASRVRFCLREGGGLLAGALTAHRDALAETYPWCLLPLRRNLMTPERRHPKTSIAFMTLTLGIIVIIIAQAQGFSLALERGIKSWHPHFGLLGSIALFCAVAWILGVAAWSVMFAMRRAGVHRLDDAQTWTK